MKKNQSSSSFNKTSFLADDVIGDDLGLGQMPIRKVKRQRLYQESSNKIRSRICSLNGLIYY